MRTTTVSAEVEKVQTAVTELVATDVSALDDGMVRHNLLALVRVANQVNAAMWAYAAAFDARGLSSVDGFKTTRYWLTAFGRVMPAAAAQIVRRGGLLRELPALAAACARGEVCADQVSRVVALVKDLGVDTVRAHDETLAGLAATTTATEVEKACERIRAHADPDGPEPKPDKDWRQRDLDVQRRGNHVLVRGRLDLQAGAALMTALDALMGPPGAGRNAHGGAAPGRRDGRPGARGPQPRLPTQSAGS